jgi:hypothetical protein
MPSKAFLPFVSKNCTYQLNSALPIGDFNYLYEIGYHDKRIQLDELLSKIDSLNRISGIKTILYLMPEYNLIENHNYFKNYINYYTQKKINTVSIINGFDDFDQRNGQEYMISVHDGHPNSKAHAIVSKTLLKNISSLKSD